MTGGDRLIVTKLRRTESGELEARVSLAGRTVPVTRRFGSWTTVPDRQGRFRDLQRWVAVELQKRARPLDREEA